MLAFGNKKIEPAHVLAQVKSSVSLCAGEADTKSAIASAALRSRVAGTLASLNPDSGTIAFSLMDAGHRRDPGALKFLRRAAARTEQNRAHTSVRAIIPDLQMLFPSLAGKSIQVAPKNFACDIPIDGTLRD
jgi:hypothetical protein